MSAMHHTCLYRHHPCSDIYLHDICIIHLLLGAVPTAGLRAQASGFRGEGVLTSSGFCETRRGNR